VPRLGVCPNSLFRRRFGETECNRVPHIDTIVLQVCYATDSTVACGPSEIVNPKHRTIFIHQRAAL